MPKRKLAFKPAFIVKGKPVGWASRTLYRDVRGIPVATDRCPDLSPSHQKCIRQRGHTGRHIGSKEYRR